MWTVSNREGDEHKMKEWFFENCVRIEFTEGNKRHGLARERKGHVGWEKEGGHVLVP